MIASAKASLWPAFGARAGGIVSVRGKPMVARRPRRPIVYHMPQWPIERLAPLFERLTRSPGKSGMRRVKRRGISCRPAAPRPNREMRCIQIGVRRTLDHRRAVKGPSVRVRAKGRLCHAARLYALCGLRRFFRSGAGRALRLAGHRQPFPISLARGRSARAKSAAQITAARQGFSRLATMFLR